MWDSKVSGSAKDVHVAFRGSFEQSGPGEVEFRLLGASWFVVWIDGKYLADGPSRFPAEYPQYQTHTMRLEAGRHTLAIQAVHIGLSTRLLENIEPFLYCAVQAGGRELPVRWKCTQLAGYANQVRRINPQLAFVEWCDTRQLPNWCALEFNDTAWTEPAAVKRTIGPMLPLSTGNVRSVIHSLAPLASGSLVSGFGYERDDPPARFFLRALAPGKLPPQGVWRRYDLGRVRLMRPRFLLDIPAGTEIEFAYCEALTQGRVSPWITLSAGASSNMDHYIARGGPQEIFPLMPRGGRFLEVHVLADPSRVRFLKEEAIERTYYGTAEGDFQCPDPLLNRIWSVGVETHRACAEDALIDNPTRERGQWAGDVVTVGMDIAASAFSDLRLCRRGLVQCAQSAREDGLVSGLCPGGGAYLSTYAAQWVTACVHYFELSGERPFLESMFPYAERNVNAFEKQSSPDGVLDSLGWGFVDWGYVRNAGPTDMGVNLHYLAALNDMVRWCRILDKSDRAAYYQQRADTLKGIIAAYFDRELARGANGWTRIGYHRAVLGLRLGFFRDEREKACIAAIKTHMLRCFPNDNSAPRLSDPGVSDARLITPYFGHFAMSVLLEHGETDFVLGQYRKCWGWALEDGRTTWLEVFDTRWSQCHQWAGCPTWQLSRYLLGLRPRFDRGLNHYDLSLAPGSMRQAQGKAPMADGSAISVSWTRTREGFRYKIVTPVPIHLHLPGQNSAAGKVIEVRDHYEMTLTNAMLSSKPQP